MKLHLFSFEKAHMLKQLVNVRSALESLAVQAVIVPSPLSSFITLVSWEYTDTHTHYKYIYTYIYKYIIYIRIIYIYIYIIYIHVYIYTSIYISICIHIYRNTYSSFPVSAIPYIHVGRLTLQRRDQSLWL